MSVAVKAAVKWRLLVYSVVMVAVLGWMYWRTRTPEPIEVQVIAQGVVEVGGRSMDLAQLAPYVVERTRTRPTREVRIVVDAKAPSTVLIPVLEVLERNGIENVQVVTNP